MANIRYKGAEKMSVSCFVEIGSELVTRWISN